MSTTTATSDLTAANGISASIFYSLMIPALLVWYIYWKISRRHMLELAEKIPGPKPLPIIGNALELLGSSSEILKILTNYAINYGGIIRIYIPPVKPGVIITDNKIIQYILSSDKILDKSMDYSFLKPWLNTGLLTADATKWKHRRRMLSPCFGRLILLKDFTDKFNLLGNTLIENLNKELNNKNLNVIPLIKTFTLDVICETSMGISIDARRNNNTEEYAKCIERLCNVVTNRLKTPFKRFSFLYRFTEDYKKETEALKVIDKFFDNIINNKLSEPRADGERCNNIAFLDLLMEHKQNGHKLSLKDLKEEVNTFIFGGYHTLAMGISFSLYELARNMEIQNKVLEEQKCVFGDLKRNIMPSYSDLQQMKYLELVINETLRMYPPAPMVGRKLANDVYLDNGMKLPKNLSVVLFIYGCHHNPKYFPDPETFIPERFENEVEPFTYLPFSGGPRNCIGKKFAILQMKSCISNILRNFIILPSKPECDLELIPEVTLRAKNGLRISLERRIID